MGVRVSGYRVLVRGIVAALLIVLWGVVCAPVFADMGEIGSGMGGIEFQKESRISMEKERLTISRWKVKVEYEFRNDTDTDVTVGVAFPVPDALCNVGYSLGKKTVFNSSVSFRVWADGKELKYSTDVRALDKDGRKDYTSLVRKLGADIEGCSIPGILSEEDRQKLLFLGLMYRSEGYSQIGWTVREKYVWTQTFPAHKTVSVKHEYAPFSGWYEFDFVVDKEEPYPVELTKDVCLGSKLLDRLGGQIPRTPYSRLVYVDYILKTANYWKSPIKDFELIVERPPGDYVTFCWDGPVERVDKLHFRAIAHDFAPKRDLKIGFVVP